MTGTQKMGMLELPKTCIPESVILSFDNYQSILSVIVGVNHLLDNVRPLIHPEEGPIDIDVLDAVGAGRAIHELNAAFHGTPFNIKDTVDSGEDDTPPPDELPF